MLGKKIAKGEQSLAKISERKKQNNKKFLSLVLGLHLSLIILIICCLSLYSPWALLREYTPDKSRFVKIWFPENVFKFFLEKLPDIFSDNYASIINVLLAEEPTQKHHIESVRLMLPNNALETLDHKMFLFRFGHLKKKALVKGNYISDDGKIYPVSFRMRGLMAHHHMIWKPSIRIKFKKVAFPGVYRNKILIASEDGVGFRGWLTSELSRQWKIVNYDEGFFRLFINEKYMGLYNHIRRLNESLTINNGEIPGYFFKLEPDPSIENWLDINSWIGIKNTPKGTNQILGLATESAEKILERKIRRGGTNRFDLTLGHLSKLIFRSVFYQNGIFV